MPVAVSMPCVIGRWPTFALGFLGENNTCGLLHSACTSHSSMRLFFERFCAALNQALTDDQTGIAIGMPSHLARWAEHQGRAGSIAVHGLSRIVANERSVAAMAFSGGIAWVDPTGEKSLAPRLIFGVGEDPAFHSESPFRISPPTIRALFRLELPQVLEDEDRRCLLRGELHNASAQHLRDLGVYGADLAPEVGIVLFVLCDDARLGSVPCKAS
jgi:hypothetical protein